MKWMVEYITNDSANILIEKPNTPKNDFEPVGMGFPPALAERIVKLHNESLEQVKNLK